MIYNPGNDFRCFEKLMKTVFEFFIDARIDAIQMTLVCLFHMLAIGKMSKISEK